MLISFIFMLVSAKTDENVVPFLPVFTVFLYTITRKLRLLFSLKSHFLLKLDFGAYFVSFWNTNWPSVNTTLGFWCGWFSSIYLFYWCWYSLTFLKTGVSLHLKKEKQITKHLSEKDVISLQYLHKIKDLVPKKLFAFWLWTKLASCFMEIRTSFSIIKCYRQEMRQSFSQKI